MAFGKLADGKALQQYTILFTNQLLSNLTGYFPASRPAAMRSNSSSKRRVSSQSTKRVLRPASIDRPKTSGQDFGVLSEQHYRIALVAQLQKQGALPYQRWVRYLAGTQLAVLHLACISVSLSQHVAALQQAHNR